MTSKSTARTSSRKSPRKPKKPRPDFPLSIHKGTGYWCKKLRGHVHYFGKVEDDPKGVAALEKFNREWPYILEGKEPPPTDVEAVTVEYLCNAFCTHQEERMHNGSIAPRTWQGLKATCANILKVFGKTRHVDDLTPDDFGKLRTRLAKNRKSVALRNEMLRVRAVFKFAKKDDLIEREVRYGSKFEAPKPKQIRKERREHREQHGKRMFERQELLTMLDALQGNPVTVEGEDDPVTLRPNPQLRAMLLLAVNCGFGQTDLARLPLQYIDLDAEHAWIDYPRPKTEADRLCPLWPETVQALREWLPHRPKARDRANADLVFLTCSRNPAYRGNRFVRTGKTGHNTDGIGQEFSKLLRRLNFKRPGERSGVGFYALRHTFRTIADETLDSVAIDLIMGHADTSMAGHYREGVLDKRLQLVTDHVREWLFRIEGDGESDQDASRPADTDDVAPRLRVVG